MVQACVLCGVVACVAGVLCAVEPVTFTAEQDHQQMMQQLGITRLRPGYSGNPADANSANYDESLANPYPDLPAALTLDDGSPVTTAAMWRDQRRPQIVELLEREVYGRIPAGVPPVTWELAETQELELAGIPVVEKQFVGRVDNAACPSIEVTIELSLTTPRDAAGPVPVLMMFGRAQLTNLNPTPEEQQRRASPWFASIVSRQDDLLRAGWGYAYLSPQSVQADHGSGLTRGIIGLTNRGQPRRPDDWGALRAWGWGASRGLDRLLGEPAVDGACVGIEGVSRYGKAALVTMAFDERFAVALVGSSGKGGTTLLRRHFGEAVENLAGGGGYHWMAGNFLKYAAEEADFGRMTPDDLPTDAHHLLALCAPRRVFISYGIPEQGDAHWLDHRGSWMAAVAAGPVFRLLGARDLGTPTDDYLSEPMPGVLEDRLGGDLAWRQHAGGHTDAPNIPHFAAWARPGHFSGADAPSR